MELPRKVLVVGGGGREHALVSALAASPSRPAVYCAPGNAGIAAEAEIVELSPDSAVGIERLLEFARSSAIDLTVVGPEAPLVLGIADRFEEAGLAVFGPPAAGARLEGSKSFTKEFLARHHIATAAFEVFEEAADARRHVESCPLPVVLKADGLAAGKGVIVARERREALEAVDAILLERRFGEAGRKLVVEEFLEGAELSLMVITDGSSYLPLETAQDYTAAYDGGLGPNTGGMGAFSPHRPLGEPAMQRVLQSVIRPTLAGLREEGIAFRGVLYAGLMLTRGGPRVLEFNVRLGDPETQPILYRLRSDFLAVVTAALAGTEAPPDETLARQVLEWDPRPAVCVVAASGGYPGSYRKGLRIEGFDAAFQSTPPGELKIFHAGTARGPSGEVVTAGGRVLGVTALGATREEARRRAYRALEEIRFEGMSYRRDIAAAE
jgi:phosphoribosylamine--glycine ligase